MNGEDFVEETCAKYYPTSEGAALHTHNGVVVELLRAETILHLTRRVLRLTSDALSRPWTVTHFQLQAWKMYDQVNGTLVAFCEKSRGLLLGYICRYASIAPVPAPLCPSLPSAHEMLVASCMIR